MRITIDIDDLLVAVQEIAQREQISAGQVVSRLLRTELAGSAQSVPQDTTATGGFRPFTARGVLVTNAEINRLRDAENL